MNRHELNPLAPHPPSRRAFLVAGGLAVSGATLTTLRQLPADEPAPPACAIPQGPDGKESIAPAYSFPPNPPVRVRKSFTDLSPDELADLASAYSLLKKGAADLSWCGQANIHANHCVSHQYYLLVHDSWLFLLNGNAVVVPHPAAGGRARLLEIIAPSGPLLPASVGSPVVSDRCAQSLCGLLRLLRRELLDTGRIGLGALVFCGRRKGKKLEPPR